MRRSCQNWRNCRGSYNRHLAGVVVRMYCSLQVPVLRCVSEVDMADNVGSKVSYFLVGLGVGALVGVLFAPKSGEETRRFLSDKADEGRDYAQKKAGELP